MGFEVVIQRVLGGRVENPAGNLHLNVYPFRFPWQGLLRNCGELVAWFSGIPYVVPDEVQEFLFQTLRLAGEGADVLLFADGAVEGGQWQVRRVSDVAGLPLLAALAALFFFLATPLTNSISRTTEFQADLFGLNAVRKPDAFASVMLKLSTYRKLEPGHWEEIVFFAHPSGRTRIETAMRWKKEHIADADIRGSAKLP